MFNAMHLLETALLMLAAFLVGATVGALARLLMRGRRTLPTSAVVQRSPVGMAPAAAQVAAAPEVVAPSEIGVPPAITVATPPPVQSAGPVMAPARIAGETTSGVLISAPRARPERDAPAGPVSEEIVSALLEVALLGSDNAPAVAEAKPEAIAVAPVEIPSAEDDEAAAMRAIEGGWTPRRRPPAALAIQAQDVPEVDAIPPAASEALPTVPSAAPMDPATSAQPIERPGRPWGIAAARLGTPDSLTNVIGILPVIETALNKLGIFHFDQVGALSDENVAWIEEYLGIEGRIGREHWREQARELSQFVATRQSAAQ